MEKDWKLFKKKLGGWQESYMDRLIEEYKDILNSDALSSDKYWALRKKIYEDYKSPGVLARDVSRSNMFIILLGLLRDEAITMDDLDEFSDELKEDIEQFIKQEKTFFAEKVTHLNDVPGSFPVVRQHFNSHSIFLNHSVSRSIQSLSMEFLLYALFINTSEFHP